jgi:hypothetical protein
LQQQQWDKSPHQFKEATTRIKAEVFGSKEKSRELETDEKKA